MIIFENIRLAWEGVRSNKMRSFLTMLGIIIGIGSVIAILTIGNGMSTSVTESMSSLGATNITVSLQSRESERSFGAMGRRIDASDLITDDMIEALRERYPDAVEYVSLTESVGSGSAEDSENYANVNITGVNTEYLEANSLTLEDGRTLSDIDEDDYRNVAIVSSKFVSSMFGGDDNAALGQQVSINMNNRKIYTFTIVGIYEDESSDSDTTNSADVSTTMYIPITTARKLANASAGYQNFTIVASTSVDLDSFATVAENFLNKYYQNNEGYEVSTSTMTSMIESMTSMMSTISIALSVIAGISLLVGGIGVMNIMLVSVTERTKEIGTRKAIGATNGAIRIQFVVESAIICLIGGILGILLGAALGYFGGMMLSSPSLPNAGHILLAVGFSMAIGIFFGYYPANKAAKLDPIEALRYE